MIAVGLSLCYIANVWNIGAEGQFLVGAVAGSWLAVRTNGTDAGAWVLPAMLVLGALGGALYALIPAICKVRFGASEILTSLMLVYVAYYGMDYLVRGPWRDPKGLNFPTTAPIRSGRHFAAADRRQPRPCRHAHRAGCRDAGRGHARPHHHGIRNQAGRRRAQSGAVFRLQCGSAGALHLCGLRRARRARRNHRSGRARSDICSPIFRRATASPPSSSPSWAGSIRSAS